MLSQRHLQIAESLKKTFGSEIASFLGDAPKSKPAISSGLVSLDKALGVGGLPHGRVTEIFGPESSGKTTLALQFVAQAQASGAMASFIDAEHALDPSWAAILGVDTSSLLISQPDYGEQGLEVVDAISAVAAPGDIIVVDSVAALVPKAELEGDMGDSHMGLHARLMSQALRKLTGTVSRSGLVLVFINQIRQNIGVTFGNPETTTGGNALKFYASVRLDVRKKSQISKGEGDDREVFGNRTKIKVVKNKVAPPFKETEVDLLFGSGFSPIGDALDTGVELKLVEKNGSWYSMDGEKLGQGRDAVVLLLRNDPKTWAKLYQKVRDALFSIGIPQIVTRPERPEDAQMPAGS